MLQYYYPRTVKGIVTAILKLFNDVVVMKYDANDVIIEEKKVPITFSPTEKYHKDRLENHTFDSDNVEHNQNYYIQIPRLALSLNGIVFDPSRSMSVNTTREWFTSSLEMPENIQRTILTDFQPTPYNYNFTLSLLNDNFDYFSQITENILPYFNPSLALRVKEFSFLNIERDLIVKMDGITTDFSEDMDENDTRKINCSLNMTIEGFMYRKWSVSNVIKNINYKFLNITESANESIIDRFRITSSEIGTSAIPPTNFFTSGTLDKTGDGIQDINFYNNKINTRS